VIEILDDTPDRAEERWSFGELMGVHHYWGDWKLVSWDSTPST
jgi:hypothetical protein